MRNKQLPTEAVGLQIGRLKGDDLVMCEAMRFPNGRAGVELVLRRAAISGRVEIEGEIEDHLAEGLLTGRFLPGHTVRVTVDDDLLKLEEVKELAMPVEFNLENIQHFIDWNRNVPFQVIRGEGECAV
jgi:hypothetical protein